MAHMIKTIGKRKTNSLKKILFFRIRIVGYQSKILGKIWSDLFCYTPYNNNVIVGKGLPFDLYQYATQTNTNAISWD